MSASLHSIPHTLPEIDGIWAWKIPPPHFQATGDKSRYDDDVVQGVIAPCCSLHAKMGGFVTSLPPTGQLFMQIIFQAGDGAVHGVHGVLQVAGQFEIERVLCMY